MDSTCLRPLNGVYPLQSSVCYPPIFHKITKHCRFFCTFEKIKTKHKKSHKKHEKNKKFKKFPSTFPVVSNPLASEGPGGPAGGRAVFACEGVLGSGGILGKTYGRYFVVRANGSGIVTVEHPSVLAWEGTGGKIRSSG